MKERTFNLQGVRCDIYAHRICELRTPLLFLLLAPATLFIKCMRMYQMYENVPTFRQRVRRSTLHVQSEGVFNYFF